MGIELSRHRETIQVDCRLFEGFAVDLIRCWRRDKEFGKRVGIGSFITAGCLLAVDPKNELIRPAATCLILATSGKGHCFRPMGVVRIIVSQTHTLPSNLRCELMISIE